MEDAGAVRGLGGRRLLIYWQVWDPPRALSSQGSGWCPEVCGTSRTRLVTPRASRQNRASGTLTSCGPTTGHSKKGLPLLLYVPKAGGTQRPGAGTVQRHLHRMSAWLSLDGLHRPSCRGSSRRGSVTF